MRRRLSITAFVVVTGTVWIATIHGGDGGSSRRRHLVVQLEAFGDDPRTTQYRVQSQQFDLIQSPQQLGNSLASQPFQRYLRYPHHVHGYKTNQMQPFAGQSPAQHSSQPWVHSTPAQDPTQQEQTQYQLPPQQQQQQQQQQVQYDLGAFQNAHSTYQPPGNTASLLHYQELLDDGHHSQQVLTHPSVTVHPMVSKLDAFVGENFDTMTQRAASFVESTQSDESSARMVPNFQENQANTGTPEEAKRDSKTSAVDRFDHYNVGVQEPEGDVEPIDNAEPGSAGPVKMDEKESAEPPPKHVQQTLMMQSILAKQQQLKSEDPTKFELQKKTAEIAVKKRKEERLRAELEARLAAIQKKNEEEAAETTKLHKALETLEETEKERELRLLMKRKEFYQHAKAFRLAGKKDVMTKKKQGYYDI